MNTNEPVLAESPIILGDGASVNVVCAKCGKEVPSGSYSSYGDASGVTTMLCEDCDTLTRTKISEASKLKVSLIKPILFGAGASFALTVVWALTMVITNMNFGIVAIFVGVLIAKAVLRASGGIRTKKLQVLVVLLTGYAIIFSEVYSGIISDSEHGLGLKIFTLFFIPIFALQHPVLLVQALAEDITPIGALIDFFALYYAYKSSDPKHISASVIRSEVSMESDRSHSGVPQPGAHQRVEEKSPVVID